MKTKLKQLVSPALLFMFAVLVITCGCEGLPKTVITIAKVEESAMTTWADAKVYGRTTPEIDAKVLAAHSIYMQAAADAEVVYRIYVNSGDKPSALAVLKTLRESVDPLLDILFPIDASIALRLKEDLAKAQTP